MQPYWTVVIPWVPHAMQTRWHPTEETGPFNPLTRGAFSSEADAIMWAKDNLQGTPYSLRFIDPVAELETDGR